MNRAVIPGEDSDEPIVKNGIHLEGDVSLRSSVVETKVRRPYRKPDRFLEEFQALSKSERLDSERFRLLLLLSHVKTKTKTEVPDVQRTKIG